MFPALFLAAPLLLVEPAAQPEPPVPDQIVFADQGNRMTVPVRIGDPTEAGPFRFVVDTGAERTVISRELAGTLGLAAGRTVRLTAIAGSGAYDTVVIPRIRVGTSDDAPGAPGVVVLGQRIEAPALVASNLGAAGLVGLDMLQGHAVTIDFDRQAMTIVPATRKTRKEHFGPDDIVVRARSLFGQLVVTDAAYEGVRVRVVLDTGSVVSIGNAALRRLVAGRKPATNAAHLTSVTGAELIADMFTMRELSLGETRFVNLPVAFSDAAPFKRLGLGDKPALLLGMDALRLFGRVRIDFANHEVRMERPHDGTIPLPRGVSDSVRF